MINFLNKLLKPKTMAKTTKMKICSISGQSFKKNAENFYANHNSADGFHPYHIKYDNARRAGNVTVEQMRTIVNSLNQ